MKIIIDGDACPSISLIELKAKEFEVEVVIFCDIDHFIQSNYSTIKVVDKGFQSVDMYVVNSIEKGDIVITQDYGLAAMCLFKAKGILNPSGYIYTQENIDKLLQDRHINQKIRKGGGRTPNPKKRTKEDEERLIFNLERIIKSSKYI